MDLDVIWQVFTSGKGHSWKKLCLLTVQIYDGDEFTKWKEVVVWESQTESQIARSFSDNGIVLALQNSEFTSTILIKKLCKYDRIAVLHRIIHFHYPSTVLATFKYAGIYNRIEFLRWIWERFDLRKCGDIHVYSNFCFYIAKWGNLQVVKWFFEVLELNTNEWGDPSLVTTTFHVAAECGHLHILEWIFRECRTVDRDEFMSFETFCQSARYGQLHVLKWFTKQFKLNRNSRKISAPVIFQYAANYGHLDTAKWLDKHFELVRTDFGKSLSHILQLITREGHLHMLKWVVQRFKITKAEMCAYHNIVFRTATEYRKLHILQWIADKFKLNRYDTYGGINRQDSLEIAILSVNLPIAKWLTKQFCLTKRDIAHRYHYILPVLAGCNQLPMLKFVAGQFGITKQELLADNYDVVRRASFSGSLDVLQWIEKSFDLG